MLLALVGPTGSGKTEASIQLAERFGAEVLSVDSMLVYRGMDIGTAKPTLKERRRVRHHLMDLAEPAERFTVAMYQTAARVAVSDLSSRGITGLAVGGSGLYYRALVDGLRFPPEDRGTRAIVERDVSAGPARTYDRLVEFDPAAAAKIQPGNVRRIVRALEVPAVTGMRFSSFADAWETYPKANVRAAGIEIAPDDLDARIGERLSRQLEDGFLEEVQVLVERGWGGWLTSTQAIGYAEFAAFVSGDTTMEEALATTVARTRRLARRQMAWFRRDPRIRWFRAGTEGAASLVDRIETFLEG